MNKYAALKEKNLKEDSFFDLAEKSLKSLSLRSQEIIKKRFGLFEDKSKTLDGIGKDYKITRERVRQIIADSFRKISKNEESKKEFNKALDRIILEIELKSGIIKQSQILAKLGEGDLKEKNAMVFFAECLKGIKAIEIKGLIEKAWIASEDVLEKVKKINNIAGQILENKKNPISKKELIEKIYRDNSEISKKEIEDFLEILSSISQNKFGKWGLFSWAEINPKSTKEKIYLILKETKKPLHFSQIAQKIDEYKLSKKKAHPQTVHNELIKDSRFVLIGRGIYALAEWGYSKGTVREVLKKILSEKSPLNKENILQEIFKARKVKIATVMINLNNPKFFIKQGDLYRIK